MYRLAPQVVLILLTVQVLQAVDGAEQDERVSRAIAQLGANQYADRESASRQLADFPQRHSARTDLFVGSVNASRW